MNDIDGTSYSSRLASMRKIAVRQCTHFQVSCMMEYDKAVYKWVLLIILESVPIPAVSDQICQEFSLHPTAIRTTTFLDVLFKPAVNVEKRIKPEIYCKKGAIIYEGWMSNGNHFIGMLTSYCRSIKTKNSGSATTLQYR